MKQMDILALLKEGRTVEDITEDFFDALVDAQEEFEKYLEEQERRAKVAAARKEQEEYKKERIKDARLELGRAMINYMEATGTVITESMYDDIEIIIDFLPRLKVYRSGKILEEFWK